MDPDLWGDLQHHIGLEDVYLKLPLREFFRLREVCKDWNRLARQRRCLTDAILKPYFVIAYPVTGPFISYHSAVLTFHIASGRWKWNRLPFESNRINPLCQPFSVKGLLLSFCSGPEGFQVYNAHTKKCLRSRIYLPPALLAWQTQLGEVEGNPSPGNIESYHALGMAVDTSVTPHTFKVIIGGPNTNTKIYDSATDKWSEMRSSAMFTAPSRRWTIKSCLNCDGVVYIWSQIQTILVYSLVEDVWSTLDPPPYQLCGNDFVVGALGYWDGRVFVVMPDGNFSLSVWELVNRAEQVWRRFARIPAEIYSWLVPRGDISTKVFANFCDELVLMYTVLGKNVSWTGVGVKIVLFNLATRLWEKHDGMDCSPAVVPLAYDWPQIRRRIEERMLQRYAARRAQRAQRAQAL